VESIELGTGSQELRMAWSFPRVLRRLGAALVHTQYALPLRCPCPAVVTIHDLSFEHGLMGRRDRLVFERVVPRAARRATRVLTVSERTKRDIVALYGVAPDRVVVTPNGVDPAFTPGNGTTDDYLLFVGAIQERKAPLVAADTAARLGRPLVVVGPEKEPPLARELERRGARLRGWVEKPELAELYRHAAAVLVPSRFEGFGLPVLEAMACGAPVVATPEPALREVAGDAALFAEPGDFPLADERALAERERLRAAGLERARAFSWAETARRTAAVYREVLAR
jgi:glycosyltransferase involved in cell wall biosynthesis